MGFKKKTGKGRLDKYYHLAKEQGYRARSAFKLIQLNKKYNFLSTAKCLVDLCAAPGGWLQVAAKYMPVPSLIIGIDLAPIKPIPNVLAFQQDITTEKCRQLLRENLKTWKVDVFLHDGAPNVGQAWVQDAYTQSELVLSSLKLAVEFLNKGGTFVTKVFRSKDYNNLMWVFGQLFRKVEATKPPSSRNISAEIFVVCRDFIAPKKIDPKFLDARHVFKEIDEDAPTGKPINIFAPEKRNRHRDGYDDGDYTLFKSVDAMTFIRADDPVAVVSRCNTLTFESDEARLLLKHPATDEEIKACCADIKVLGKRDFKILLRWQKEMVKAFKIDEEKQRAAEAEAAAAKEAEGGSGSSGEEDSTDDEDAIADELDNLTKEEDRKKKREKRRKAEKRRKEIERMQLKMIVPTDIGMDQAADEELFNLGKIKKSDVSDEDADGDVHMGDEDDAAGVELSSDEEGLQMEDELDAMYNSYREKRMARDPKYRVKQLRNQETEFTGFDAPKRDSDSSSGSEDEDSDLGEADAVNDEDDEAAIRAMKLRAREERKRKRAAQQNPLLMDMDEDDAAAQKPASQRAKDWFSQDLFAGISDGEDEAGDAKAVSADRRKKEMAESSDEASDDDDVEVVAREISDYESDAGSDAGAEAGHGGSNDVDLITAEAMTLAQSLVNRKKTRASLIDDGFNKRAFNDDQGLPAWFLDDENRHNKINLPVTKEAVRAIREKLKLLNARPIKKIAEAKARKKMRAVQRAAKMAKKANNIAENDDMTEAEKASSIAKLAAKQAAKRPKQEVKLVVARGSNRGLQGRPKGVKGRYKMVDSRMKKELRSQKRIEKKLKKRRK
ncbi:Spb1 C-terminal domain-containing protein [Thamnocephalis sphaerospora]|uniref:Spb1 C-terminal domain-containing protein n=1 Tax=Thamnocephalis sphaerospora TaxID=78915 RepID=A0A4P9XWY7_9FUNG|nr:Spb1 C-terminal domain-containing protein [Thamnocephalis sphaerospora]|eukprot:RKP09950.1 Spb1 C-terminal domain-containing protein [Thamnocephalis sphaerospora]